MRTLARRSAFGIALIAAVSACGDDGTSTDASATTTTRRPGTSESTTITAPATTAAQTSNTTTAAPATTATAQPATTAKPTVTARPTTTVAPTPTTSRAGDLGGVRIRLTQVASAGSPIALVTRPGHAPMYLASKTGEVRVMVNGRVEATPVLDITGQVSQGGEQGLLSIAFSPDGSFLYVFYTDTGGDERLDEYAFGAGDRAIDVASRRNVATVPDPASNHNGGTIVFGPDGYLWWSLGDGGGANDQFGNAQDPNALLGKILRIDPRPSGGAAYRSAPDNPHAGGRGGGRPEIAVTGCRNPWRISFDRGTGDLWIGDVGQNRYEEVDRLRKGAILGANLGWPFREGAHPFNGRTPPPGVTDPVYDYGRDDGQAVVGGFVYRGSAIPALQGIYVFSDTYTAGIHLLSVGTGGTQHRNTGIDVPGGIVSSFAEGVGGELYVLSLQGGGIFRIDRA